jgi:hypothetical protein
VPARRVELRGEEVQEAPSGPKTGPMNSAFQNGVPSFR